MEALTGRVSGAEIEWSVTVPGTKPGSSHQLEASDITPYVRTYLQQVPHTPYMSMPNTTAPDPANSCFLGNGSRLYTDSGSHKETATAEDISPLGIFASEIAAERIMSTILNGVGLSASGDTKELGDFSLNKRAVDEYGNTWGYHESYCSDARAVQINPDSLALWGIHLATRSVLTGAGSLDRQGKYWIAQKAPQSGQDFANSTLGANKPLVNLRNEQLADPTKDIRVHAISGDPNMSPWASRMKFGCASLVLRLMEHGDNLPDMRFYEPLNVVARSVGAYATHDQAHLSLDLDPVTALDAQERLVRAACTLAEQVSLPVEELWTIAEWEKVCADMRQDLSVVANRVEWLLKRRTLERYREKHGLPWNHGLLRRKDRQWDNIGPAGIGMKLRENETAWSEWMPSEALIQSRLTTPPVTTRAYLRGSFIEHFGAKPGAGANWDKLQFRHSVVRLDDPYATTSKVLDELLQRAAA